jgi:hypothetical protein
LSETSFILDLSLFPVSPASFITKTLFASGKKAKAISRVSFIDIASFTPVKSLNPVTSEGR